jgi:hypothetical protein
MTPDATVVATIGVIAVLRGGRLLLVVPVLWCAFSGATLLAMHSPEAWVVFAAGAAGVAGFLRQWRDTRQCTNTT